MSRLEFWFDFSCPYAYLASTQVEALAARCDLELDVRPMLLGGVFRVHQVPQKLFAAHGPEKTRHGANDIRRSAIVAGVPLVMPPGHPIRTVEALRAMLVVGAPYLRLGHAFFRAYWVEGIDISTQAGLRQVLAAEGHDADQVLTECAKPEVKDELRRRTDEAVEKGVFGAPAFIYEDELYWGFDRMEMIERRAGLAPEALRPAREARVDFFFDYSSPFAYLAAGQVRRYFGDGLRYRPMLLGAIFKMVGQVNVPLHAMNQPKQRFVGQDLIRQAEDAGLPFSWPSRFPMKTTLPLRVTMLALAEKPGEAPDLIESIFGAYWADDRDISSAAVMTELLQSCGMDAKRMLARAAEQSVKDELRAATQAAVDAGVFGTPTFLLDVGAEAPSLYWGSDRLPMVSAAANGRRDLW